MSDAAESAPEVRRAIDDEHLRLLRLAYLVMGWLSIAVSLVPLGILTFFGALFGASFGAVAQQKPEVLPLAFFGCFYFAIFGVVAILSAGKGALDLAAAKAIGERRSTTLIQVAAAVSCVGVPWGTLLGVLTFHVLSRPSVAATFTRPG